MQEKSFQCTKCGETKGEKSFQPRPYDGVKGFYGQCKSCQSAYRASFRRTAKGRARQAWNNLYWRSENRDGRHPSYASVMLEMEKNEFLRWAEIEYKRWEEATPHLTPSLDRIDNNGPYKLGNLRLVSHQSNSCNRATLDKRIKELEMELSRLRKARQELN